MARHRWSSKLLIAWLMVVFWWYVSCPQTLLKDNTHTLSSSPLKGVWVEKGMGGTQETQPTFFILLCAGGAGNIGEGGQKQLNQTFVLIKSAVALTSVTLRFIVLTDTVKIFNQLVSMMEVWPREFQQRLQMDRHPIYYPSGREILRNLFRPCSSARFFLTKLFPDLDIAVYLDTDTVFLRRPEEMWTQFKNFDNVQAIAMAPDTYGRKRTKTIATYGTHGLNTGVIMMNLTRLRTFPGGGFIKAAMDTYDNYSNTLTDTKTNDMFNIIFSKHPEYMYPLDSEWNYCWWICDIPRSNLSSLYSRGASIVHATGGQFFTLRNLKFKAVYLAWEQYVMGSPLSSLLDALDHALKIIQTKPLTEWNTSICNKIKEVDQLLTEALRQRISSSDNPLNAP